MARIHFLSVVFTVLAAIIPLGSATHAIAAEAASPATASATTVSPTPVTALAYRADNRLLVAGVRDELALIEPSQGEILARLSGLPGRITATSFDAATVLAVAAGSPGISGIVRLYQTSGSDQPRLVHEWKAHDDAIYALRFSPDGKLLATAGYDRQIKLWNWDGKALPTLRHTLTDHSDAVYALAFHPQGTWLASAAADRAVKIWDPRSGTRLYTLSEATDWLYSLAWHPDGKHLAAGGVDRSIRVWQVDAHGGRLIHSVFAHDGAVTALHYTADGRTLYSIGEDRRVKSWNTGRMTEQSVLPPRPDVLLATALRSDGKQLALGSYDGSTVLVDLAKLQVVATPLPEPAKPPEIQQTSPKELIRGKTQQITIIGNHLQNVDTISVSSAAVQARLLPSSRQPTSLIVEFTLPESLAPGPLEFTLRNRAGQAKATIWVNRYPTIEEPVETSSPTSRQLQIPSTILGRLHRPGEIDKFTILAMPGQEIGIQAHPVDPRTPFEPMLQVTDARGQRVAAGRSGIVAFTAVHPGPYTLVIWDQEYRGGTNYQYRLDVGPFPVISSIFPLAVSRGTSTAVRLQGVNLGKTTTQTVSVPATDIVGSRVPLPLLNFPEPVVGMTSIAVAEFPSIAVDGSIAAELKTIPGSADGILTSNAPQHRVKFHAKKGQRLLIECHAANLGSLVDPSIEIVDAAGVPVPQAVLRCTARVYVSFRDHDASKPGIRLESWNELAVDDYLFHNGDLMRIKALPRNPDDDCQFYQVNGRRLAFLGTTPSHHAIGSAMYKVEIHPPGQEFPPNGMPLIPLAYRNDDGGPGYGKDSLITFDPPADGFYTVRIQDATGASGSDHAYRLTVRPPRPDFQIQFSPTAPRIPANGAAAISVTATRIDGFDGPITVEFADLPPSFAARPTVVEAGQSTAELPLVATSDAGTAAITGAAPTSLISPLRLFGRAEIDGRIVTREARGAVPTIVAEGDLTITVDSPTLTIRPGHEARLKVRIHRRNGFTGRVPLEVRGLPHGVRVLNVGLNGILVTPNQTEREIVLAAEPWLRPQTRPLIILARHEKNKTDVVAPDVQLIVHAGTEVNVSRGP